MYKAVLWQRKHILLLTTIFQSGTTRDSKILLPPGSLIELCSSIQGHPDAGGNWQEKVNSNLASLDWKQTKHEPCLYRREVDNTPVQLMCRQVDDMLLAVKTGEEYHEFNKSIGSLLNMEPKNKLATSFNGIEIEQAEGYIAIRVDKYISKVISNHGWEKETYSKKAKSLLNNTLAREILDSGKDATAKMPEAIVLEKEMDFPYRMLLGELIFAFVVVRLDIGYSMSLLSRFTEYPAKVHYLCLKSVARYLRDTKDRPIVYWRKTPLVGLPKGTFISYKKPENAN